jgi:SOS-response transcriptional repressor LexA
MPDTPRPLTPRQAAVYAFIHATFRETGSAPSLHEIRRQFKLASTASVSAVLAALQHKGWLVVAPGVPRGITLTQPDTCAPTLIPGRNGKGAQP